MEAVNTLLEANPDTPSYMIGISENKITRVPLMEAVEMVRSRELGSRERAQEVNDVLQHRPAMLLQQ